MYGIVGKAVRRACCRGAELCVCNFAKKLGSLIPTVSECEPIASFCYYTGIHRHRGFQLLVEICAMNGEFLRHHTVVELVAGDTCAPMTPLRTSDNGILEMLGSRGSLFVNQRHTVLEMIVYRKHIVTKRRIATASFNIDQEIIDAGFPKNKWYHLKDGSKIIGRVQVSFHIINAYENVIDCLVLQQALLCAQDYKKTGKDIKTELTNEKIMLEHEKLYLFSFALEGALIARNNYASEMRYFKATIVKGSWQWCYWSSKAECRENQKSQGSIPILAISTVIRHPTDYSSFYVKYYTKEGTVDLILKAVDRNRDVWTDALYLFIEQARLYLEHFENFSALESVVMV